MSDLRKEFRGPHLKAEAPRESDAHDDYPMSLSLAVSLARPGNTAGNPGGGE